MGLLWTSKKEMDRRESCVSRRTTPSTYVPMEPAAQANPAIAALCADIVAHPERYEVVIYGGLRAKADHRVGIGRISEIINIVATSAAEMTLMDQAREGFNEHDQAELESRIWAALKQDAPPPLHG